MKPDNLQVGLVIRHVYLWRYEAEHGHEEGRKARPCVIIHLRQNSYGKTEVFIAPITHTPPRFRERAQEIPIDTKKRLGLDGDKSWVITHEVNRFTWVGPDFRKTPKGQFSYGYLPAALTRDIIGQIRQHAQEKKITVTDRDE